MTIFFRRALWLAASASAPLVLLPIVSAVAAPDSCLTVGGVATCSGDQSAGITYKNDGTVVEIDVTKLTKKIAPGSGVPAVDFEFTTTNGDSHALTVRTDATLAGATQAADGLFVKTSGGFGSGGSGGSASHNNGGDGGVGGTGGGIAIFSAGAISTQGDGANAIDAEASGGQGGGGGGPFGLGKGGKGGDGGTSGNIGITNSAVLMTTGKGANGIFTLAAGGNGNKGGAGAKGIGGVNGAAGAGGAAGNVTIVNTAAITTGADTASAIYGHAMGGHGADGATGGESGASGGGGGAVSIDNSAAILTSGSKAYGLYAETQGGGGGNGIFVSGAIVTGGSGGAGGTSGPTDVSDKSTIATSGDSAIGIFGLSVGGLGGLGANAGGVISKSGSGGAGGDAGAVDVDVALGASVTTVGAHAHAVQALSIGGAGNSGGNAGGLFADAAGGGAGGSGSQVSVTNEGSLHTGGDFAYGIYAESSGGAGGRGGSVGGAVTLGGDSGGGGSGGNVNVTSSGSIVTAGRGSYAIFAQSVGGTGGDAGDTNGLIGIGGGGGDAAKALCESDSTKCNNAGQVIVENDGVLTTTGDLASAIFAESIGGGGGNGGAVTSFISVGGGGGAGGDGNLVDIANNGAVSVSGNAAHGIFAQSIGGGGGTAGDATSIGFSSQVAFGGSGGSGGNGGPVEVTNSGTILDQGNNSSAIFVQSIGGGGGNGGDASASGISALTLAVGGSGGDGGSGGIVTVTNNNLIEVAGDHSNGVFAQSVGGGGGVGGSAYAFGISPVVNVSVTVGGSGGGGGGANNVLVTNNGEIDTWGDDSRGVFAQSVGGGGGAGGSSSANALSASPTQAVAFAFAIGGTGGNGGVGADVDIENKSLIATLGSDSSAIEAQSVGGGGGVGGDGSASATSFGAEGSASISLSIGGRGGKGNDAGAVTVNNSGAVQAFGDFSNGIIAQSIGGGGGDGGLGSSDATEISTRADVTLKGGKKLATLVGQKLKLIGKTAKTEKKGKDIAISIAVGGAGGSGGNGGTIVVNNSGSIETWGASGLGVYAESIGGGGGIGAEASGDTEKIPLSRGIEVGGGFGGNGGSSGDGGAVTVTNSGTVVTHNIQADGVVAQSIGGGGGMAGAGAGDSGLVALDINVGGNGGSAGNGGHVVINQTGSILTQASNSFGILAQSIGGGGGVAGAADANYTGKISVGGNGGSAGNGAAVDVNASGTITTQAEGSFGIVAQSIGGGGGIAGDAAGQAIVLLGHTVYDKPTVGLLAFGGNAGGGGDGGVVTIISTAVITTSGAGADGIETQSIGGGGGIGGGTDAAASSTKGSDGNVGHGNAVNVTQRASILATGLNADGIFAQSVGCEVSATTDCKIPPGIGGGLIVLLPTSLGPDAGGGNIAIAVSAGTIEGGTGSGAGIELNDGKNNTVTIASNATVTAVSGLAIRGTSDDSSVTYVATNSGAVNGDVILTGGKSAVFNNLQDAAFRPNATVDLGGANGQLNNSGLLQPGGAGTGAVVALNGNLVENASATYDIDVGFGISVTDRIDASGNATVGGTIVPHFTALMNQNENIVTSVGTMTNANPTSTFNSVVLHFSLAFGAHALTLTPIANWAPLGMTNNEESVGHYFQAIWDAGGAVPLAGDMGILAQISALPNYADALNHMTPAAYATAIAGEQSNAQDFADNMMSCHGQSAERTAISEEDCSWVELSAGQRKQSATIAADPSSYHNTRFQFGRQQHLNQDWLIGGALGYDNWNGTTDSLGSTSGQDFSAGLVAKYLDGDWVHAAALTVAFGNLAAQRLVTIPVPTPVQGHTSTLVAGLRGRSTYLVDAGALYFKPYADLDLDYFHMSGFQETGGGALNLHVADVGKFAASLSPMLEAGTVFVLSDSSFVRPYLISGVTVSTGGIGSVSAGFEGAPSSIPDFTISEPSHSVMARVGGGLELLNSNSVVLKIQYDERLAGHYSSWNGLAKLGIEF